MTTAPLALGLPVDAAAANKLLAGIWVAGKTVWPRDIELAARAVAEGRRAVLLGEGSVLYVNSPPQLAEQ